MVEKRPPVFKLERIIVIGLVFFSFFMAALVSRTVFERLPHLEDEIAYLYQARIFAGGQVTVETPEPRRAFWQPFVVDYAETGNRFGKYTPGWPALLAVGIQLGQPWIINAFFAALTVALVYRLGREVFGSEVGIVAAALTAFSPMALLLNATLMGHTAALFFFTLFVVAYWRIERGTQPLRWGIVAGIALGLLIVNRPLTALGVTTPFVIWSGLKMLRAAYRQFVTAVDRQFFPTLRPLLAIAAIALVIGGAVPLFNYAATGQATKNLYTLVWWYDRIGFGECCGHAAERGEGGHTIVKGILHARLDLSLTAADLFGWQNGLVDSGLQEHARSGRPVYWPKEGLSFFLLPLGLLVGFRRWWLGAWALIGMAWLVIPPAADMDFLKESADTIWLWLGIGALWILIPPLAFTVLNWKRRIRISNAWTWLLLGVAVSLVGLHLAYWIGSQRYSTRYYFEALTALALLSALPIVWLAQRTDRLVVYGVLVAALLWSLYGYSTPRISALRGYNQISRDLIEQVEVRQVDERPVLVIVTGQQGSVRWRSYGSLMAVTGPYLESEIVAAWDYNPGSDVRERILEQFPDRQIIEMQARDNEAWFVCNPGADTTSSPDCGESLSDRGS